MHITKCFFIKVLGNYYIFEVDSDNGQFHAIFRAMDNKTVLRKRAPFLVASTHFGGTHDGNVINTSADELFELFLIVSGTYRSIGVCSLILSPPLMLILIFFSGYKWILCHLWKFSPPLLNSRGGDREKRKKKVEDNTLIQNIYLQINFTK